MAAELQDSTKIGGGRFIQVDHRVEILVTERYRDTSFTRPDRNLPSLKFSGARPSTGGALASTRSVASSRTDPCVGEADTPTFLLVQRWHDPTHFAPTMNTIPVFAARGRLAIAAALTLLWLPECVAVSPDHELAAAAPSFSPEGFFAGKTAGSGTLRVVFSRSREVRVAGNGNVDNDGTFVLTQTVMEGDKPARTRVWHLHRVGGNRFTGTLTDAVGPVTGDAHGNLFHLRFRAKGGLRIEQWLYLQPDSRTSLNRMVVRKFGIPVAALSETIRRVP